MPQGATQLVVILLLVAMGYLFLIRPTRRRAREVETMQKSLRAGSEVMLTSGIFGHVVSVGEEKVELEVSPGTVVSVHRGAVGKVLSGPRGIEPETDRAEPSSLDGYGEDSGSTPTSSADSIDTEDRGAN